jgi:hypothetical protein
MGFSPSQFYSPKRTFWPRWTLLQVLRVQLVLAIGAAVSRRLPAVRGRVRWQASSCHSTGGQSCIGVGFLITSVYSSQLSLYLCFIWLNLFCGRWIVESLIARDSHRNKIKSSRSVTCWHVYDSENLETWGIRDCNRNCSSNCGANFSL